MILGIRIGSSYDKSLLIDLYLVLNYWSLGLKVMIVYYL